MHYNPNIIADNGYGASIDKKLGVTLPIGLTITIDSLYFFKQKDGMFMSLNMWLEPDRDIPFDYYDNGDIMYNTIQTNYKDIIKAFFISILKIEKADKIMDFITTAGLMSDKKYSLANSYFYYRITNEKTFNLLKKHTNTKLDSFFTYDIFYSVKDDSFNISRDANRRYSGLNNLYYIPEAINRSSVYHLAENNNDIYGLFKCSIALPTSTSEEKVVKELKDAVNKIKLHIDDKVNYYQSIQAKQGKEIPIVVTIKNDERVGYGR